MKRAITEYAKKILADHGCDRTTYWGETGENIIRDLKEAYPDGMEYPYVDVANAMLLLARPTLLERQPYLMVYDMGHTVDGIEFESFEAAKEDALDTLIEWQMQQIEQYKNIHGPEDWPAALTQEQREDWNYMVGNCSVQVQKYNPDTDEYEDYWEPSYEDEKQVGWVYIEEMEGGAEK